MIVKITNDFKHFKDIKMRYFTFFLRAITGMFFIFSGFVKLVDPLGLSYKLEEYFAPDVLDLAFLMPYSLFFAFSLNVIEILLGIAIIIGYKKKLTLVSMLSLTIFFTFLTFYSAYFNKVTDCGCFGDALKLEPWTSFYKDVVLLVIILAIMFLGNKYIKLFNQFIRKILIATTLVTCLIIGFYSLRYIPIIDFRAYSVGTDIREEMTIKPEDIPVYKNYLYYEIDNEIIKYEVENSPWDNPNAKYIKTESELIKEGKLPKIKDFSLEKSNVDALPHILEMEKAYLIISYNLDKASEKGWDKIEEFMNQNSNDSIFIATSSPKIGIEKIKRNNKTTSNYGFHFCDEKALKTIVRSNPGIIRVEKGIITGKWPWRNIDEIK